MDEDDIYGAEIYGEAVPQYERPAPSAAEADVPAYEPLYGVKQEAAASASDKEELEELRQQVADSAAREADLQAARAAEKHLLDEAATLRARDVTLQQALAERNIDNVELRRQLAAARQAADPHIAQARQLLLDPAVAAEFERLKGEADAAAREARGLREELQAAHFSQESKVGRLLMAKCRALQEENEELGREAAEGRVAGLERQLALARGAVADMRRAYLELEDAAQQLDAEAEELQLQVFMLKHQIRFLEEHEAASRSGGGGGGGGGDFRERPRPGPPPRFGKRMEPYPGFGGPNPSQEGFHNHHTPPGMGGGGGMTVGGGGGGGLGDGDRKRGVPPRDRSGYGGGGKRPR
ncbi:hypothetical protein WJX81_004983 [Elliptochloris bilobata]|uniref:Uncharacterized protein n=1 Tax=Elliptochloris bilobata TaxID=381761 RepID=A0AAW1SD32_9CHLO